MSVIDRRFNGSIIPQETQSDNNIQVFILGKAHWVAAQEITYLEGDGNYTYIYTRRGKRYLVSKNMKSIQETLNAGFLRVHKSYTINPYHLVACVQSDMLLLSCGKEIPIARRRIRETHEMLAGHN